MTDSVFAYKVKVFYEDTDAQKVVYYANYLKYFERTRTMWMNWQGVSLSKLATIENISFVVRSVNVDYMLPAKLEDELWITLEATALNKASMSLEQKVYRNNDINANNDNQTRLLISKHDDTDSYNISRKLLDSTKAIIRSNVTLATINLDTLRPVRIPYHLFTQIK